MSHNSARLVLGEPSSSSAVVRRVIDVLDVVGIAVFDFRYVRSEKNDGEFVTRPCHGKFFNNNNLI